MSILMYLRVLILDVLDSFERFFDDPKLLGGFVAIGGTLITLFQNYIFNDFDMIGIVIVFILIDTLAGWRRVRHLHRVDPANNPPPSKQKMRYGLAKKSIEWSIMLTALYLFSRVVAKLGVIEVFDTEINFLVAIPNGTTLFLIYQEMESIDKNLKAVGRRFLPFVYITKLAGVFGYNPEKEPTP